MIIVAIIAIATLGGMWLRRRYRKIERQQLVASIAVIVDRAEHDGAQQSTILAVLRQPDTVGIFGTFLFSSWVRPTRT